MKETQLPLQCISKIIPVSRTVPAVVGQTHSLVAGYFPVASWVAAEKVVAPCPGSFPRVPHDDQAPVAVETVDLLEAGDMVGVAHRQTWRGEEEEANEKEEEGVIETVVFFLCRWKGVPVAI